MNLTAGGGATHRLWLEGPPSNGRLWIANHVASVCGRSCRGQGFGDRTDLDRRFHLASGLECTQSTIPVQKVRSVSRT